MSGSSSALATRAFSRKAVNLSVPQGITSSSVCSKSFHDLYRLPAALFEGVSDNVFEGQVLGPIFVFVGSMVDEQHLRHTALLPTKKRGMLDAQTSWEICEFLNL